jgi:uncharacterized damage-inducible protein DinB
MKTPEIQSKIIEIIQKLRLYGQWILEGISPSELDWSPDDKYAQTIIQYFRHIVNAEIYWLKHIGDNTFEYEPESVKFQKLLQKYIQLEKYLISKINNASEEELAIRLPLFENDTLVQQGSMVWLILRTSLHAVHHFGQIAHIRYSLNNPPDAETRKVTWGEAMDVIIKAMLL